MKQFLLELKKLCILHQCDIEIHAIEAYDVQVTRGEPLVIGSSVLEVQSPWGGFESLTQIVDCALDALEVKE